MSFPAQNKLESTCILVWDITVTQHLINAGFSGFTSSVGATPALIVSYQQPSRYRLDQFVDPVDGAMHHHSTASRVLSSDSVLGQKFAAAESGTEVGVIYEIC